MFYIFLSGCYSPDQLFLVWWMWNFKVLGAVGIDMTLSEAEYYMCKQQRLWPDCSHVQARLSICCSPMWYLGTLFTWGQLFGLSTIWIAGHDKTTCTQRRLGSPWASASQIIVHGSLLTHWAHSEDSDQTGRILLVLSFIGSFHYSFLHHFELMAADSE